MYTLHRAGLNGKDTTRRSLMGKMSRILSAGLLLSLVSTAWVLNQIAPVAHLTIQIGEVRVHFDGDLVRK